MKTPQGLVRAAFLFSRLAIHLHPLGLRNSVRQVAAWKLGWLRRWSPSLFILGTLEATIHMCKRQILGRPDDTSFQPKKHRDFVTLAAQSHSPTSKDSVG